MFILLGIALVAGLGLGFAMRGRPGNLRFIELRGVWLAIGSAVAGLSPLVVELSGTIRTAIQIVTMLGILVFIAVNVRATTGLLRAGLAAVVVGWALNFAVIAANGAMPMSLWAYERSGQTEAPTPGEGGFFKIELAGQDTLLRPLGDVIPIAALGRVLSIGDFALLAGVMLAVAGGTQERRAGAARDA